VTEVLIMYLAICYDGETICQRLNRVHEATAASVLQVHCSFHVDLEGSKFTGLDMSFLTFMSGSLVTQECAGTCKSKHAGIVSGRK